MKLRTLQYLVAIADEQHFSKAAERCYVSQPTLSAQIQKLEEELDVQLIERTNRKVMLTPIGLTIVDQARQMLLTQESIKTIAKQARSPFSGTLRLGFIPTVAPSLLPLIVPALRKKYSQLHFHFVEEKTHVLVDEIKKGHLDAAILALPIADNLLVEQSIYHEPFMLAVPTNHVYAKQKTVTQGAIKNAELLLLQEGHCLRDQSLEICQNQPEGALAATSLETLRYMVAAGEGITLLPKLSCHKTTGIHFCTIKRPRPTRTIGMIYRKTNNRKPVFTAIADLIHKRVAGIESIS